MPACIEPKLIQSYLAGQVAADLLHSIEAHLKNCQSCQATLAKFTPSPEPLLMATRDVPPPGALEQEPELAKVISVIGAFHSDSSPQASKKSTNSEPQLPQIRDYQIVKKIGEGGMGTVYLAIQSRLDKKVALKILKADLTGNPQAIARFEREWLAVGKLEHPHIVRAHHAGEEGGVYFLAMEYIEGRDLAKLLQSKGKFRIPQACELIRQAALGLQHAHDSNLVHRDVKPSNLILTLNGQVKVLDLGLAQLQSEVTEIRDLTRDDQLVGTWSFMAPEQLSPGNTVDARSDIFSLGVTFYSFLAGSLPLSRGQSAVQLPPITSQRGDVPAPIQALLDQMLTPNPDERIATMAEVAKALEPHAKPIERASSKKKIAENQTGAFGLSSVTASHLPTPAASTIQPRRNWKRPAAIGGGSLALLLLLIGSLVIVDRSADGALFGKYFRANPLAEPAFVMEMGSLSVQPAEEGNTTLPELFAAKKAREPGAKEARIPLHAGDNRLPVGTYYIFSGHQDWQASPQEVIVDKRGTAFVKIENLPHVPWLYPRLPDVTGAYMEGGGTIWMEGMIDQAGKKFELTYKLQFAMAEKEDYVDNQGKRSHCRWMMVQVNTLGRSGLLYSESARLLVDVDEYNRSNNLLIRRGWLTASSKSIERRLQYLFGDAESVTGPKPTPTKITVKFNPNKDMIRSRTDELLIRLPTPRISVPDALNLLFGAELDSDPSRLSEVRLRLAKDSKREGARELVTGAPKGDLYCWGVKSQEDYEPGNDELGYSYYRNESVPFSVVKIDANMENFAATFNLTGYGNDAANSAAARIGEVANKPKLETDEKQFAALQRETVHFDEASLPKHAGAMVAYKASISRGGVPERLFEVQIRLAKSNSNSNENPANAPTSSWIEVKVASKSGEPFEEEALLRLTDARASGGKITIDHGWIRNQGALFPFDPQGDRESLDTRLLKLGKNRPGSPLNVHDVLALLFGVELKATQHISELRTKVALLVEEMGLNRLWTSEDAAGNLPIELFDTSRRPGEIWSVSAPPGLRYNIFRSRELPFDFQKVIFSMPGTFKLTAVLDSYKDKDAPSLLSATTNDPEKLAAEFEKEAPYTGPQNDEAEGDNWRVWREAQNKWSEYAEFRGLLQDGTVILFCQREGGQIEERRVLPKELRKEDREWIALGRWWTFNNGARGRALYVERSSTSVTLKGVNGIEKTFKLNQLSNLDQDWIRYQDQLLTPRPK